jgi:hypothetical protein
VDGRKLLDAQQGDWSLARKAWAPAQVSAYTLGCGNESQQGRSSDPHIYPWQIAPEVTGYGIWRRSEALLDDPQTGRHVVACPRFTRGSLTFAATERGTTCPRPRMPTACPWEVHVRRSEPARRQHGT